MVPQYMASLSAFFVSVFSCWVWTEKYTCMVNCMRGCTVGIPMDAKVNPPKDQLSHRQLGSSKLHNQSGRDASRTKIHSHLESVHVIWFPYYILFIATSTSRLHFLPIWPMLLLALNKQLSRALCHSLTITRIDQPLCGYSCMPDPFAYSLQTWVLFWTYLCSSGL